MFNWCNLIAIECNAKNAEELKHCFSLLNQLGLYRAPKDHGLSQWLLQIFSSEANTKQVESAFNHLANPVSKPLSQQYMKALQSQLPKNEIWLDWLNELQIILNTLDVNKKQVSHIAWREHDSWELLLEHVVATGIQRFSVQQNQAMLAMWWPQVKNKWEFFIEQELENLDLSVRDKTLDYLKINYTDRWKNRQHVQLDLLLTNRFPESLQLNQLECTQNNKTKTITNTSPELPIVLPTSDTETLLTIEIDTENPDQLESKLTFQCRLFGSNQPLSIEHSIIKQRNLLHISEDPIWIPSWKRLARLLEKWDQQKVPFYWIDGDVWPDKVRARLWEDLLNKYTLEQRITNKIISEDELTNGLVLQTFSPDIALAASPERLLEQFHSLLKPITKENQVFWALAIWNEARGIPKSIYNVLKNKLPDSKAVLALLDSLLGKNCRDRLLDSIKNLPQAAFGSWLHNAPFYTPRDKSMEVSDIYLSSSCLLPMYFWQAIDKKSVAESEIAELLDLSIEKVKVEQRFRKLFYRYANRFYSDTKHSIKLSERVVRHLFSRLGASGLNAESAMWWVSMEITLNWQDYSLCYLLPKCTAVVRGQMREVALKKHSTDRAIWLCLGETNPPDDLSGLVLALSEQDTLSLMHVRDKKEAARLLNQIAAREHGVQIHAQQTFRSAGGLGSLVEKHFGGREKELDILWSCLTEADKKGAAALIIGGRRIGKTSLREKILFKVERKQPRRVCLVFNFEGKGEDPNRVGIELEFWFFKRIQEAFREKGYTFDDNWPKSLRNNLDRRDEARALLKTYLDTLKTRTEHVPLFIFDETENLVRWDTALDGDKCWSLFALMRDLTQEGRLCLFATSYPHGLDSPHSLNVANNSSGNSVHNSFPFIATLEPWSPKTTWDYLSSRLAGLGVVLPLRYRDELLEISCGIPWIIHAFGLQTCRALPDGNKIVYSQTWGIVKTHVLNEIYENLKVSVIDLANTLDLEMALLDTRSQLGNGQLWRAFKTLANQPAVSFRDNANYWPQPLLFSTQELEALLPDVNLSVLQEALRRLSSSPVLEGIVSKKNQFVFANNLFPTWLKYTQ